MYFFNLLMNLWVNQDRTNEHRYLDQKWVEHADFWFRGKKDFALLIRIEENNVQNFYIESSCLNQGHLFQFHINRKRFKLKLFKGK